MPTADLHERPAGARWRARRAQGSPSGSACGRHVWEEGEHAEDQAGRCVWGRVEEKALHGNASRARGGADGCAVRFSSDVDALAHKAECGRSKSWATPPSASSKELRNNRSSNRSRGRTRRRSPCNSRCPPPGPHQNARQTPGSKKMARAKRQNLEGRVACMRV